MTAITRRRFIHATASAGAGLLLAPAIVGRARAQTTLTVASLFGDDKPETKIWLKIRDLVEEKLPGKFNFNIVRNAALGGEKEIAEGIRLGSIQASLSTVSALSGWVPEVQILDLPFLFRNAAHVRKVVEGRTGAELKQKLAAQQFIVGGFINYGARHLLTKEPVTRPRQLAGQRIRVIQSPLHTKLWSAFGTTPIGIPITETYNALKTGVADAMDLTKSAYAGFKLYEVVPYLTETGHIWASGVVYFSTGFWNGLSDGDKEVFQQAATEGAAHFDQLIVEDEDRSVALAAKHGGKVIAPEARDEWEKGARGVWEDFAGIVGGADKIEAIGSLS
ncbi:TRAP transporter substrate-binding protein [Manganibacter manganicus]|jgi:tripartite ATP-independent transporter DctP family solute receptor|uniref:ABC transporter substrate-binding protein n=1 Tax=Manganibacter manganicus TaxID=1873176 RepID=A0A1V8RSC7_9HYPH|nr:TRAP transporter substrate-binding protein [Pseudaminobacter manganicus]OQM76038.1 ABC transporter substrate-binding protein [Pseudaminobacter manganicus]